MLLTPSPASMTATPPDPPLPAAFTTATMVVIPACNEEACITQVVHRLRTLGFPHIRVVANGCTDRTAAAARHAGAEVIEIPRRGYGLACWTASQNIPHGIHWLLYCNADASDDFSAYPRFATLAPSHDLILGARTHPDDRAHLTLPQRLGNWLIPTLIRLRWGHRYTDLGPQRLIRASAFQRLHLRDRGFGWTVEMQVRALQENLRITEIPVRTHPRPAGQSKISGSLRGSLAASLVILLTLGRLIFTKP